MSESPDVIVVGTGVIGLAVAWELLQRGLSVGVVGPRSGDHQGGASRAAGAMLSVFSEIESHHTPQRVAVETAERLAAHELYPGWLEQLIAGPARSGTWVLAQTGQRARLDPIAKAARGAGHPVEWHHGSDIPGIEAVGGSAALWLPTEAWIDTRILLCALTGSIRAHRQARWFDTTAVQVGHRSVRCADGDVLTGGNIVLAAGTAIPTLLGEAVSGLGIPPILAGAGVGFELRKTVSGLEHVVRTPNAAFACGVHLVPRTETLYVGATNRLTLSTDPEKQPSVAEVSALINDAVAAVDHRLAAGEILTLRKGLRPYTLDHLPLIGRTHEPSILVATATYRSGVLLAPRVARLIADEITGVGSLDQHPFRVLRPMEVPDAGTVAADALDDILEHFLRGAGRLAPDAEKQLAAFLPVALHAILAGDGAGTPKALRRLWRAAPVPEVIPSLFALAARLEGDR